MGQGISIVPWAALFGPAKMPADLTAQLSREINTVLSRPETREQFDRQGFEPRASTSQELAAFHKTQWDSWTKTTREQGIKFE
jgi:tripartite-type tricarboxylate transporter receptor subunit TctC